MPFIIAGILYGAIAGPALIVIAGVCLAWRRPPSRATLGGAVGSLAGFVFGCVAGALVCMAGTVSGARVGATAVVVMAGLGVALLGTALGATA